MNRYTYSYNNPVNYVDPSGHRPCGASCPNDVTTWELQFGSAWYGSWDVKQQEANAAKFETLLFAVSETTAGILWEPADWAIALNDGVQWYDGVALLPVIPAGAGRALGNTDFMVKYIPTGWIRHKDDLVQFGVWGIPDQPRNLSEAAEAYQTYITGALNGYEFNRAGVWFDGVRFSETDGSIVPVLLDAKHWSSGCMSMVETHDWASKPVIAEANRQLKAAGDLTVQWHAPTREISDRLSAFFAEHNIKGIDVVHTDFP